MKISSLGNATAAVSQSVWESFIELQSRGEQLDTLRPLCLLAPGHGWWAQVLHLGIAIPPQPQAVNRDYLKESAYA